MRENLVKRIEALVCTGSPGLYRVLTFWAVQHVYSLDELGHTASSMSIAQMAGFFTAIGWATLILVRLPATASRREAIDVFYPLVAMAGLSTLLVTAGSVVISRSGIAQFDVQAFVALLWGWSGYQVARHYFVAHKQYRLTVAFDLALIVISCLLIWFGKRYGQSSPSCLAIALGAIAATMFFTIGAPRHSFKLTSFEIKGLQFGLTNFLSGGVSLVFVPAAKLMCGASFAGILSLFGSVTSVGILVPRAISMMLLPEIAKRRAKSMPLDDILRFMGRIIGWANGAILLVNILVVLGLTAWQGGDRNERIAIIAAGVLMAVQCAVGVMGTASSSVMMVLERSREAAWINIKTSALFAILCSCSFLYGGSSGFRCMLISAIAIAALRNFMIQNDAREATVAYEKTDCGGATERRKSAPLR